MRYNVEAKDFTLLDCADNVADMGEWGNYAAEQLRGKKTEKVSGLMDVMRGMYDHKKTGIEEMTKGLSPSAKNTVIAATNRLLPAGRCNNCMTYFPADKWEEMTECPHCKTDNYLMDMPGLAASTEMFDILVEVEAHSRMRRPIKKATWLKVCEVLKKVDGVNR